MRIVLQRVTRARVTVDGRETGAVGRGYLLLVGFETADGDNPDLGREMDALASKILKLRLFPDGDGVMNRNLAEAAGGLLAVSQFTLFAATRKGNRPSWSRAARPEVAAPLFQDFVARLTAAWGQPVATGEFGAEMAVELVNDGPVTLLLDSRAPE